MTTNKPMTSEQLDELMTVAANMQRNAEADCNRPAAMFAYAVQVAVLELHKVRNDAAALAAENAGLKAAIDNHSQCFTVCKCCGTENDCSHDDVCRAVNEVHETEDFLAEVRAHGVEMFVAFCGEENSVFVETKAYYRSLPDAADEFASELRKGVH